MHALKDFFTTDYGLLSAIVLFLILGMLAWFVRFFVSNIQRDAQRAEAAALSAGKPAESQS